MTNFTNEQPFMQNRERSWLRFNERVLEEARDVNVPLMERLKFISIFTSNLDEFFMIRVGSLTDLALMNHDYVDNKTGLNAQEQLDMIYENVIPLYRLRDEIFFKVEEQLRGFGVANVSFNEIGADEQLHMKDYFKQHILPHLNPEVIDFNQPLPHLSNKGLYIICSLSDQEEAFGLIPVPQSMPSLVFLPGVLKRYMLIEQIVLYFTPTLFLMDDVQHASIISVTRNADISPKNVAVQFEVDFRKKMKEALKKRDKLAPVRLEVQEQIDPRILDLLMKHLQLDQEQVFFSQAPLVLQYSDEIEKRLPKRSKKALYYRPYKPQIPKELSKHGRVTSEIQKQDRILFYPYHSMEPFLQLLKESAEDPNVRSIGITIYRLSDQSKVVKYLQQAVKNNKEVTVLIELKARFDEQNNISWAEMLEKSGCHVIYGVEDYKVHSKICLITRHNDDGNKSYITQVGTGNYNEKTAEQYTDLHLLTSNTEIGRDTEIFFQNMKLLNLNGIYKHLLVAPHGLRNKVIDLIDREILKAQQGMPAGIIIKSNSLTEKETLEKLSEASQAGVNIQLIIRGICCLLPGIKGKTENVTVTSVVGRFLEHSRVFCFGVGDEMDMYISSADLMTRNVFRRVEIACPIFDQTIKRKIWEDLHTMLVDNVKGRVMLPDGRYVRKYVEGDPLINCQEQFIEGVTREALVKKQHKQGQL